MGDTELLYVTLAILFFGGITTSINKYMIMNNEDAINNQYEYQAVSIAQEVIESVKSRKFDENISVPSGGFNKDAAPLQFESPYAMTNESEKYAYFDDVDDYCGGWTEKGYKPFRTKVSSDLGDFDVSTVVYYVKPGNLDVPSKNREYYKKLTVTVSHERLVRDVILEHVYAYYIEN